jgi:hypothetical protein
MKKLSGLSTGEPLTIQQPIYEIERKMLHTGKHPTA